MRGSLVSSAEAQVVLRPAPVGMNGQPSAIGVYVNDVAPVAADVALPDDISPDLAEWVELLRTYPIARAAAELDRRHNAPTEVLDTVSTGRHAVTPAPAPIQVPTPVPVPLSTPRSAEPADSTAEKRPVIEPEVAAYDVYDDDVVDDVDDDGRYLYLPAEDDYTLNKKGHRVFPYVSPEGAGHIAVDADRNIFTDADGNFIPVTVKGVALDDRTGVAGHFGKLRNLMRSGGASSTALADDLPTLYDEHGAPIEHFPVDAIGPAGSSKFGMITNRVWGTRRLAFTVAVAAIVSALALGTGILWGRGAVPAAGMISNEEAAVFRLNTMPVAAMAAFGETYLDACLTHGNREEMAARAVTLARMSSGGATTGCGWTEGGEVQNPLTIAFTGRVKPMEGFFDVGRGAYLEYLVATRAGAYWTYTVPIWVQDDYESNDMIVVGDIGKTPGMRIARPGEYQPEGEPDTKLAAELRTNLLKPYLTAWAASDRTQIDLAVTDDATPNATRGLGNSYRSPEIDEVVAYTLVRADGNEVFYSQGDTVMLATTVTWKVPGSAQNLPDSTQTTGYRIEVVRVGGKWMVRDINGGSVGDRAAQANPDAPSAGTDSTTPGIAGIVPGQTGGAAQTSAAEPSSTATEQPEPTSALDSP